MKKRFGFRVDLPWRRKLRLIYPQFQLRLLGLQVLVTCVILAVVAWQNQRSFEHFRSMGAKVALPPGHPYFKFLEEQNSLFHSYLYIAFGIGLVLSTLVTLVLSHRLAGPIVRTTAYLDEIIENKKIPDQPLAFRESDFFKELPAKLNEALYSIRETPKK